MASTEAYPSNSMMDVLLADPIFRFLADGGSWADAVEMEEEMMAETKAKEQAKRLEEAVASIPKWEAQLAALLRKPQNPSALRHKARLLKSLREAYAHAGQDPSKAKKVAVAPKGANSFAGLADSSDEE